MFKTIINSVSRIIKVPRRHQNQCCWCVTEPLDPCTQVSILHNGVRIATEEVDSPVTCVTMTLAVGSRYENEYTNGLTHFIEHIAFKGFKTMCRDRLEDMFMCMSAKGTAYTSREKQVFSVTLPSENATAAVDKLYRIISELDINDCQMDLERYNIKLELDDCENNPKKVVFDYLHATAFQGTPLAQRVIGSTENISRFDACQASHFMCEHYQPYRIILSTSGGVSHETIMQYADMRFGCIAPQPCCEPDPGPSRFSGSQALYRDDTMPFCHVAIAFEAPGYLSPHYLTMLVMKHIVGSWHRSQGFGEGIAAKAARAFACSDMCEMYKSFYIPYRDVGLFGVYFVADRWKLDEAVSYIQEQWMHLCTMVQHNEVERGMNGVRLELAKRYDNVVNSSYDIGEQMMYVCGRKSLEYLLEAVDKIEVKHVWDLADKCLYDKCPAVAAVGPTETLPDYLRIRSGQWWLRV